MHFMLNLPMPNYIKYIISKICTEQEQFRNNMNCVENWILRGAIQECGKFDVAIMRPSLKIAPRF